MENPPGDQLNTQTPPSPPQTPPVQQPAVQTLPLHKSRVKIITLAILTIFAVVFITASFFITYVKTPLSSSTFNKVIADFIMGLPFTPKTPDYIIRRAILAGPSMERYSFDVSLAADGVNNNLLGLGSDKLDLGAKGVSDISDLKNPQVDASVLATKNLTFDIKLKNNKTYIKINKIPAALITTLALFGFPEKTVTDMQQKWIYIDNTPADTQARKLADEQDSSQSEKKFFDIIDDALRNGEIKMESTLSRETLDGKNTYKIFSVLDKNSINSIERVFYKAALEMNNSGIPDTTSRYEASLSKMIPKMNVTTWIDSSRYYTYQINLSFTMTNPNYSDSTAGYDSVALMMPSNLSMLPSTLKKSEVPVSIVMKYSDIGKPVNIQLPKESISFDELSNKIVKEMQNSSSSGILNPINTLAKANNAKRRMDAHSILNALRYYKADKSSLPAGITTYPMEVSKSGLDICSQLVPSYIVRLPVDPSLDDKNTNSVIDCTSNYSTGYKVSQSADGSFITVTAPFAELGEIISETL